MHHEANSPFIRRAELRDAEQLAQLGAATFTETFGHLYPPEDLQSFLLSAHSVDSWRKTLSDPNIAVSVAEVESGRKIGFIGSGACKLPVQNLEATAGEVQQLYVLAEYHNLRLGTRLMDAGLDWLELQGRTPIYVGVWSENYGAQRFYERYGFSKIGEYGFRVGGTIDREFILKR
jgi:diamine N-acetyltransferase